MCEEFVPRTAASYELKGQVTCSFMYFLKVSSSSVDVI